MEKEPLTTGQIAEYCHVTYRAVLKWITEGKLKAYRTPGKHSRVRVEDFLAFLKEYNMPLPAELKLESQRRRILVADDDKAITGLIRNILVDEKAYELQMAFDGFTAGQKFCAFQPDLVILDINMPGLNGYEVCSYIRADLGNKKVAIIAISGSPDPQVKEKIIRMGANDFVAKPFELDAFKKKVDRLVKLKSQKEDTLERR